MPAEAPRAEESRDAELEVDGAKVRRAGEVCLFESPPLDVDGTYT